MRIGRGRWLSASEARVSLHFCRCEYLFSLTMNDLPLYLAHVNMLTFYITVHLVQGHQASLAIIMNKDKQSVPN